MKDNILIGLCIAIIILLGVLIHIESYAQEDVNRDGQVNALDLLIVQKKIIQDMEEDDKNENVQ